MSDLRKAISDAMEGKEKEEVVEENIEESTESIEEIEADSGESEDVELEASEEVETPDEESEEAFEERDTAPEEDVEPIKAPQFWNEASKQAFSQLPRDLQEQVAEADRKTQGYVTQLNQRASQLESTVNSVNEVLAPYQDVIMSDGGDPVNYIKKLFYWDSHIRNNPVEGILQLMQNNGVELSQLTAQEQYVDPYVRQQEQRINQLESMLQANQQKQQEQVLASLEQEVVAFSGEMDEQGNVAHPHMQDERVVRNMISLIPAIRNTSQNSSNSEILKKAYNLSVYDLGLSTPQTTQQPKKKPVSIKEAKAKKVSSSVTGSGTGKSPKAKANGTRAALEASIEELGINL